MRTNRMAVALAVALVLIAPPAEAYPQALEADGAAALGVALRRLGTTKRVLMIAAHPDDENTAVIAELALGDGADVAYLSLTRGEGGQNLIGPELQQGLGLIRTEELLAARRLDGARQFFTRAYDYGFSKSADEAFSQWPRDSLLADVVEVVRRYRPDIIIAVFGGTPADGHGQHQAAGIMAREAFVAAADPARYAGQLGAGLAPHAARYLFQAQFRPSPSAALRLSTGDLDPLFGRSRYQIAMQSRSRHRSQDMGRAEPIGPQATSLVVLAGDHPGGGSLFASLDTTLSQRARSAGASADLVNALAQYESSARSVRAMYNPLRAHELVRPLIDARARLRTVRLPEGGTFDALRFALEQEERDVADALRLAAGVIVDVVADTPHPVPGEQFGVTVTVWNGGRDTLSVDSAVLRLPRGWTAAVGGSTGAVRLAPNGVLRRAFVVGVPVDAQVTEAYFLRAAQDGAMYRWPSDPDVRGLPFEPAPVRAALVLAAGASFKHEREAGFVDVDKAIGELRRPLLVVPRFNVLVEPRTMAVPAGNVTPRVVTVTVSSAVPRATSGTLRLDVPAGWAVTPAVAPVQFARPGDTRTLEFRVTPPSNAAGRQTIGASFTADDVAYRRGYTLISYPHIRPQPLYRDAEVHVSSFAVQVADGLRVGYIEGAGDDGALALRQLGVHVTPLDAAALANADLSAYDAIVAGIRAYEVRPDLLAHNDRLLDYARAGGTFIVQYNKYELVDGDFMPFPATMARPHGRVTDERAAVTLLNPQHPLLRLPNRITAADFEGWVQERGLYYLDAWDERYTPLLAMADPGEAAQRGALVVAQLGRGFYVYTGLALFRQWPEGVPGAYRLLANLVSLGRAVAIMP